MKGGSIAQLKEIEERNKQLIEKILATSSKRGMTITDIVNEAKERKAELSWQTVKRHLCKLEAVQRVDVERLGNSEVYYFNGQGEFQIPIQLTKNQKLFLDIFRSPWGDPYIRIKESKRKGERWEDRGAVIISKDKVGEVVKQLQKLKANMAKLEN